MLSIAPARYRRWLPLGAALMAICLARAPAAQPAPAAAPSPALDALVKRLVIEHAPRAIEKSENWGHTKQLTTRVDLLAERGTLRARRHRVPVNEGTWKWYRCELVDPAHDLDIHIVPRPDASDGAKQFDVSTVARVKVNARWQKWESGVRLASIGGEAKAVVRLDLGCRVKVDLDTSKFPPDLVVTPRVERAEVRLIDVDLDRLGVLRGDLAEELGRALRPTLQHEIARRQGELQPKLNAAIAARQGDLRFSLTSWVSKGWSSWCSPDAPKAGGGK